MARFPKIDSPCPLKIEEQLRIDGYCGRCDKHVHALDGMSDAERAALLQKAKSSLCVSYRVPQRRTAGFGVAIAATLVATSAFAGEPPCATLAAAPIAGPPAPMPATPVVPASLVADPEQLDFIMVGGVSEPGEVEWVGDGARPESSGTEQATELEYIVITGGVNDPVDAAWVDDATLPELPILALQDKAEPDLDRIMIIGGGVTDPANAEWIDDRTLPDLPIVTAGRASVTATNTDATDVNAPD